MGVLPNLPPSGGYDHIITAIDSSQDTCWPHASLGCEPSRVFHGRIPHNILEYIIGYNPNPR